MSKYIWANTFAAIVLISLTAITFLFKGQKLKNSRRLVLLIICSVLFIYKVLQYSYYQLIGMHHMVPMEFSQIAYFLFPLSVFLSKKTKALLPVGTFCAILAGFFYNFSWIVSAKTFFERETIYQMITAFIFHNILYFGGMLVLTNEKMSIKQFWQLPLGVTGIIGWHYLMHALVDNNRDIILKSICEAEILNNIMPSIAENSLIIGLYYTIAIMTLFGSFFAFYRFNRAFTKNCLMDLKKPTKDIKST